MKKKANILFLILLISISYIPKTYAYCLESEKNYFKETESKYTLTYSYDETTKKYSISYYLPEPLRFSIVLDIKDKNATYKYTEKATIITGDKLYGTYEVEYIGVTSACYETIKTVTFVVPKQNEYYGSDACKGIEDFSLCQKEYEREVTKEEFEERVEIYKESLDKKNEEKQSSKAPTVIEKEKLIDRVKTYITENTIFVIVIASFVILSIITIIILIKSAKKSRRLE